MRWSEKHCYLASEYPPRQFGRGGRYSRASCVRATKPRMPGAMLRVITLPQWARSLNRALSRLLYHRYFSSFFVLCLSFFCCYFSLLFFVSGFHSLIIINEIAKLSGITLSFVYISRVRVITSGIHELRNGPHSLFYS